MDALTHIAALCQEVMDNPGMDPAGTIVAISKIVGGEKKENQDIGTLGVNATRLLEQIHSMAVQAGIRGMMLDPALVRKAIESAPPLPSPQAEALEADFQSWWAAQMKAMQDRQAMPLFQPFARQFAQAVWNAALQSRADNTSTQQEPQP